MGLLRKKQNEVQISNKYYSLIRDKWANKMSGLTSGLSINKLFLLLAGFVIVSTGLIILILYKGLKIDASQNINNISISKISDTDNNFKSNTLKPFPISSHEYKKIIAFKSHMDSLRADPKKKSTYDSIKLFRPGLLDSLAFIENYYKSNVKD